jgi:hypothetical protein
VHPNGALQTKPWGTKEFGAIDPNGVCVTFQQPLLYDPKWGGRDLRNGGTAFEMIRAESFGLAKQCDDFVKHVAAKKTNQ